MVGFITKEDLKDWKRLSCLIGWFSAIQFIVVTLIAMLFFPGGYNFSGHYFSHLGLTQVMGVPNPISRALFVIAGVLAGVGLIPFWIVMTTLFTKPLIARIISMIGSICGLISSPFLMALVIYPGDTYGFEHMISTMIFFLLFAASIFIYSIAMLFKKDYPKIYPLIGVIFSIVIVMFMYGFFAAINVAMQKIVVYCFCLWTAFQGTRVWKEAKP